MMYCPQCKAEYRAGFTHCADCDVDLVHAFPEEDLSKRKRELPAGLTAVLWHGADAHFYLELLAALGGKRVPSLGRPTNPPTYRSFQEQPPDTQIGVEFEVRVSEKNLPFARWMLASLEESEKEDIEEQAEEDSGQDAVDADVSPEVMGICPLCEAQFTQACRGCPNCGVPLRAPRGAALKENPAKLLCNLPHPQFLADLRKVLHRAGIPFNNANFPQGPDSRRTAVAVLRSDFARATEVLTQALQYWEFHMDTNLWLGQDPREPYLPHRSRYGLFYEDLEFLL